MGHRATLNVARVPRCGHRAAFDTARVPRRPPRRPSRGAGATGQAAAWRRDRRDRRVALRLRRFRDASARSRRSSASAAQPRQPAPDPRRAPTPGSRTTHLRPCPAGPPGRHRRGRVRQPRPGRRIRPWDGRQAGAQTAPEPPVRCGDSRRAAVVIVARGRVGQRLQDGLQLLRPDQHRTGRGHSGRRCRRGGRGWRRGGHRCRPVDRVNAPRRDARDGAASWVAGGVRRWPPVADSGSIQPSPIASICASRERGAPARWRRWRAGPARETPPDDDPPGPPGRQRLLDRGHAQLEHLGQLVASSGSRRPRHGAAARARRGWPGAASAAAAADRLGSGLLLVAQVGDQGPAACWLTRPGRLVRAGCSSVRPLDGSRGRYHRSRPGRPGRTGPGRRRAARSRGP